MSQLWYFRELFASRRFREILDALDLNASEPVRMRSNLVLRIARDSWYVDPPSGPLDIHLEIRKAGEIGVDIELSPYKPYRTDQTEENSLKDPRLAMKNDLALEIRNAVDATESLEMAHQRYKKAWRASSSRVVVVKTGESNLGPDEFADDLARVIPILVDIVDQAVSRKGTGGSRR